MNKRNMLLLLTVLGLLGDTGMATEFDTTLGRIYINGFISQGFMWSEGNNFYAGTEEGTFQFNETGLAFSTDATDRLHIGMQLFSRDLGDLGNNKLDIDWAYADYRWKDWLGFRLGKVKGITGLYTDTRDIDMLRTYIFLPQSLYDEMMRNTLMATYGGGIYGYVPLGKGGTWYYQLIYGETAIETDSSMVKFLEERTNSEVLQVDTSNSFEGKLEWYPPIDGLRVSAGLATIDLDMISRTTVQAPWVGDLVPPGLVFEYSMRNLHVVAFSLEYTWRDLMLAAEYEELRATESVPFWPGRDVYERGYYVSLAYRLTDWWELGTYYTVRHEERGRSEADFHAWQKEAVLTSRFDINEHWAWKIEGRLVNGTALFLKQDNPDGFEEDSFLLAVKSTYHF